MLANDDKYPVEHIFEFELVYASLMDPLELGARMLR